MAKRNGSRVVIVGGGIAGPALGIFLGRIGLDVVLYERRSREAVGGRRSRLRDVGKACRPSHPFPKGESHSPVRGVRYEEDR